MLEGSNMEHSKLRQLLILSLYEELSGSESTELESHLKTCSACQQELDGLRRFHSELSSASAEPLSPPTVEKRAKTSVRLPISERNFAFVYLVTSAVTSK